MVRCEEYFQSLLDYLSAPEADPNRYHRVGTIIAGNRQERNPFVSYISAYSMTYAPPIIVKQVPVQPGILSGDGDQYFSDRVVPFDESNPKPSQPFDAHRVDSVVSLRLPTGPLLFTKEGSDDLIAQFSTLQYTDAGLVVGNSDFDQSMILASFQKELGLILQAT